jgi:hypothetical protein
VIGVLGLPILVLPLLMGRLGLRLTRDLMVGTTFLLLVAGTVMQGGYSGPIGAFFPVFPIVAALVMPRKLATVWGGAFILVAAGFVLIEVRGFVFVNHVPVELREIIRLTGGLTVLIVVLALAILYSETLSRALRTSERSTDDIQRAAERLAAHNAVLRALGETANRYHVSLDFPALFKEICEAVRSALGWEYVAITARVDRTGEAYVVARTINEQPQLRSVEESGRDPIARVEPLFRDEFRISNSYFIDHRHADTVREFTSLTPSVGAVELAGDASDPEHAWHPEDVLLIPIRLRGEVLGLLSVDEPRDGARPTLEDIQALELFANHAAIAIENACLFHEQRDRTAELEHAYSELRSSQEQLVLSEKMAALGRVTAGIAHEINSPLGGVLNSLQLARGYAREYAESLEDPEVGPEDHRQIAVELDETLVLAE